MSVLLVAVRHRDRRVRAVAHPYGNWIFAVGGNKEAARAIGVPANNVKIGLFVTTSFAGASSA